MSVALSGGIRAGLVFGVLAATATGPLCLVGLLAAPYVPVGLTHNQRRWIVRSVARGEAPPDPSLAPAVIEYAPRLRRRSFTDPRHRGLIVLLATASILLVWQEASVRDWLGVASMLALVGSSAASAIREPRRLARAQAAQRAAEGLLGHG